MSNGAPTSADNCFAGEMSACDDLYGDSPVGSADDRYETHVLAGNRPAQVLRCTAVFPVQAPTAG